MARRPPATFRGAWRANAKKVYISGTSSSLTNMFYQQSNEAKVLEDAFEGFLDFTVLHSQVCSLLHKYNF